MWRDVTLFLARLAGDISVCRPTFKSPLVPASHDRCCAIFGAQCGRVVLCPVRHPWGGAARGVRWKLGVSGPKAIDRSKIGLARGFGSMAFLVPRLPPAVIRVARCERWAAAWAGGASIWASVVESLKPWEGAPRSAHESGGTDWQIPAHRNKK